MSNNRLFKKLFTIIWFVLLLLPFIVGVASLYHTNLNHETTKVVDLSTNFAWVFKNTCGLVISPFKLFGYDYDLLSVIDVICPRTDNLFTYYSNYVLRLSFVKLIIDLLITIFDATLGLPTRLLQRGMKGSDNN